MLILKEGFNLVLSVLPPKPLLHPWEYPKSPWSRLNITMLAPFLVECNIYLVNAFSKWVKVAISLTASSEFTIENLHHMFATHDRVQRKLILQLVLEKKNFS